MVDAYQPDWTIEPNGIQRPLGNVEAGHSTNGILPVGKICRWITEDNFDAQCQSSLCIGYPESTEVLEHGL